MKTLNIGNVGNSKRIQHIFNADFYLDVVKDYKHINSFVWNLNKFPYPFINNEFDFIFCSHVLEHLDNPQKAIYEIMRIGKTALIYVPHRYSKLGKIDKRPFGHKNTFNHMWFVNVLEKIDVQYSINLSWGLLRPLDLEVMITK